MSAKIFKNSLPYFLLMGAAIFMFRGIFARGFMSGYDNSFHYYDAYFMINTLIPKYHWISGWNMRVMAGIPIFVDYYQAGFIIIAILNKLFFMPLALSYKVMVMASYASLGVFFYKLASYRFGRTAALVMALCLMLQRDIYYDRILNGIWCNYLGIGLFMLFYHVLDKNIETLTLKKALLLGLLLGLIVLTHLYVAIFAFIVVLLYLPGYVKGALRRQDTYPALVIYFSIPLLAFAVSAYYLYGFVISSGYFTKLGKEPLKEGLAWSLKSFFGPLDRVEHVLPTAFVNLPVLMRIVFGFSGVYLFFKNEANPTIKRFLRSLLFFIAIALILFSNILARFAFWQKIPLITTLQFSRFLIYIQLGLYIFAAYGIHRILKTFRVKKPFIAVTVILMACSVLFHYMYFADAASVTLDKSANMSYVRDVWSWINDNIKGESSRITYQSTLGNVDDPVLKRSDVFALSGIFTKVPQIGVFRSASPFPQEFFMRNDHGSIFGRETGSVGAPFVRDTMEYFNSSYIVTVEPDLRNKLETSDIFVKEARMGPFDIFRLKNPIEKWIAFTKEGEYKIDEFTDEKVVVDIHNNSVDNEAFIKIAYHPMWKAALNGKSVPIKHDAHSLMKIELPEKGDFRLELAFNSFSPVLVSFSFLSFLSAALLITFKK